MARRGRWLVGTMAVLVLLAVGCSSSDSTSLGDRVSPHESFPVGSSAFFRLNAHCGVEFETIDGSTWRTKPRDDGQGNPPPGWPQTIPGTLTRPSKDRAVFVSDQIPVRVVFRPAPKATYTCA
jgi:hypothetical protein